MTMDYSKQRFGEKNRRAAQIVQSLLTEGYTLIAQSNACEVCTLKHTSNGNRISVEVGELGVYVFKNQRLVKLELI